MLKKLFSFFLMFNGISTKDSVAGESKWDRMRQEEQERERRAAEVRARSSTTPPSSGGVSTASDSEQSRN